MLQTNDRVPPFAIPDDKGQTKSFEHLTGKTGLVIYFYPKDMTPGCIAEAEFFRDHHDAFLDAGVRVVGVSGDSVESHADFRMKKKINFPLLADTTREMCRSFGVLVEVKEEGKQATEKISRTSFLCRADGTVAEVFEKVDPKTHVPVVLEKAKALAS